MLARSINVVAAVGPSSVIAYAGSLASLAAPIAGG
jgi:hypothetical protein